MFLARLNWETFVPTAKFPSLAKPWEFLFLSILEFYLSVVRNEPKIQQAFSIRRQQSTGSRLKMPGTEIKQQMCKEIKLTDCGTERNGTLKWVLPMFLC